MSKKTGLWLMIGGAAVSVADVVTKGKIYGAGAPLEKMNWKVYSTTTKDWYVNISDVVAVVGAFIYFR